MSLSLSHPLHLNSKPLPKGKKTYLTCVRDAQQHNTSALMQDIEQMFPNLPSVNHSPYDAFVTIVFRDIQNYIDVKNDPHYLSVVNPDHGNFADGPSTMMAFGWFEKHVADGRLVEEP